MYVIFIAHLVQNSELRLSTHGHLCGTVLLTSFNNYTEMIMTATAMLRTTLISVVCVLVVMSVFIFITGFVCGHYFNQRWRESADKNKQPESQNNPKIVESDLELKENVAYITLRPTT